MPSRVLRAVGCPPVCSQGCGVPPVLSGLWSTLLCAEGCGVPSCALRAVGCPPVCGGATEACRSLQEVGGHLLWKRLESGCSWDKLVSPG